MSADLSSQVTADMGPAMRGVQAFMRLFDQLGAKIRTVSAEAGNLARKVADPKALKKAAEGASKSGGAGGQIGGGLLGGLGIGGGFGALAVGALAAGVAVRAFTEEQRRNIEILSRSIDTRNRLTEAEDAARRSVEKSAADKTLKEETSIRRLLTMGGQTAVELADAVAQEFNIPISDARQGVALNLQAGGKATDLENLVTAAELTALGMGFVEAMKEVLKGPNGEDRQSQYANSRRILRKEFGASGTDREVDAFYNRASGDIAGSPLLQHLGSATGAENQTQALAELIGAAAVEGMARVELARMKSPETAAQVEANIKTSQEMEKLRILAEKEDSTFMGRAYRTILQSWLVPGRSALQELNDASEVNRRAAFQGTE